MVPSVQPSAGIVVSNRPATYGLPLVWDAVSNAAGYIVYSSRDASAWNMVTNVSGTSVVARILTNTIPLLAVTAYDSFGLESEQSAVLTKTNYLGLSTLAASNVAGPWQVIQTNVVLNTQAFGFFNLSINKFDNWKTLP